jgi:hypothetical protein
MAEINKEIEEIEKMLSALGDPTPNNLIDEEEEPEDKEEASEKGDKEEALEENTDEEEEGEPDKDKIIDSLRKRLNEAPSENVLEKKEGEPEEKEKEEENKVSPLKLEEQDFIGELDLDDDIRDKEAFNKLLNSVYSKGVNDSKRIATEDVLSSIPNIVKYNLTLLTSLKEASDDFYKENSDLTPFKRVVAAVFEEIAANNPDKKYNELINLVAPEARRRLELHKQAIRKEDIEEKDKPPRLHNIKSGHRQSQSHKSNTSALEKEISEMNSILRR